MPLVSVMPSNHLFLGHPILLLPSIFLGIRVFSNESAFPIMCPKYWGFSFSISPSNKYSGLISLKVDWFDLLAVLGVSGVFSIQHRSSKASVFWHSAPSLRSSYRNSMWPLGTPWPWPCGPLSAEWCLLFNKLSRFATAFLPGHNHLLISWLQSPSTVILRPKKRKSVTTLPFPLLFAMKYWGQMPWS